MGSEMTTGNDGTSRESGELDEAERASMFAATNATKNRAGHVRAGRVNVPFKFIAWIGAGVLVLGLGGQIAQHFFSTYGKAATTTTTRPVLKGTPTTNPNLPSLISLQVFMGLKDIGQAVAPTFTLRNQSGHRWRLSSHKGQVIVLAFYNSICNDICPVLGAEIRLAAGELGVNAGKIDFVIVNTDPKATKISKRSRALSVPGLVDTPSVTLLSGPTETLNRVWSAYGVRVTVGAKRGEVSHNNVLYFIGPDGALVSYAQPFGNQSTSGQYSLSGPILRTYARAIAGTASSLVQ
jgi:cytochrome oxidase Cu insertion factor (SCO1/SenC/PrrC family)